MSELKSLVTLQRKEIDLMGRAFINYKKKGTSQSKGAVTSRLKGLEEKWIAIQVRHQDILNSQKQAAEEDAGLKDAEKYFTDESLTAAEEKFIDVRGEFLDVLESFNPPTSRNTTTLKENVSTQITVQRKLPVMKLPCFSGKYADWSSFKDLFEAVVVKADITDVERLQYLKSCLADDAAMLIKNISITDDNYKRAWEKLESHYDNKRYIVNSCLNALFQIRPLTKESSSELKVLRDSTADAIETLDSLERPIEHWDDVLVYVTVQRLDARSRRDWETELGDSTEPPTYEQIRKFMTKKVQALEAIEHGQDSLFTSATPSQSSQGGATRFKRSNSDKVVAHNTVEKGKETCTYCKQHHYLMACAAFKRLEACKRRDFVSSNKLCYNCLGSHTVRDCRSVHRCKECQGKHHTLLHLEGSQKTYIQGASQGDAETSNDTVKINAYTTHKQQVAGRILLGTALVKVGVEDRFVVLRALIDPCSETTFIKESVVQLLRAPRRKANVTIGVIGGNSPTIARSRVKVWITARFPIKTTWEVEALVLTRLTEYVPPSPPISEDLFFLQDLQLADPNLSANKPIDLVLGIDEYTQILKTGVRKNLSANIIAQETSLGWVVSGRTGLIRQHAVAHTCTTNEDLLQALHKFWQQEEVPSSNCIQWTDEETKCEQHFKETTRRNQEGRYILRLPFKEGHPKPGDSLEIAKRMFVRMERRFLQDPNLYKLYKDFIEEYVQLGHAEFINFDEIDHNKAFFLPHHGVVRQRGEESKLRVVFNGSVKLSGSNLNELLFTGPKLQVELRDVVQRWRRWRFVWSGDIVKMFRQIRIDPRDQSYMLIVWRNTPAEPWQCIKLSTVTYGLVCAPYQALRTLRQLATDERERFPTVVSILELDTYVDDAFGGADTPEEAQCKKEEFTKLLLAGGFVLSKWMTNNPQLLDEHAITKQETFPLETDKEEEHKVLGISWKPSTDVFVFKVNWRPAEGAITKRMVLSQTARLYDPEGWASPATVRFKIFLQSLWHLGAQWDEELPTHYQTQWRELISDIPNLSNLSIPRWIGTLSDSKIELHGFSDASEKAMAAVVYARVVRTNLPSLCTLLVAKVKVAPIKQISLPRLELHAATMLAKLVKNQADILNYKEASKFLWSDSTITLSWIQGHPSRWNTYVANRVSQIQTTLPEATWLHVPGINNPADIASRGISAVELLQDVSWINGPDFLRSSSADLCASSNFTPLSECPEERRQVHATNLKQIQEADLLKRYSQLNKLLRVTARCLQFIENTRKPHQQPESSNKQKAPNRFSLEKLYTKVPVLTPSDLKMALEFWIKRTQQLHFGQVIKQIKEGKALQKHNPLFRLSPILDTQDFMRVGGRLRHSLLDSDERNPIILPSRSTLTKLIIWDMHHRQLHGGTQLVLSNIRRKFWIIKGRTTVKSSIFQCVKCWRQNPKVEHQLMADLPSTRVRPARAFLHSGVDFAGPINLRLSKGRGTKSYKGYIVVFVCFTTRAVHLEAASDYTAQEFISVYRRFVARRGICATLTSDCGTNFIGADKELRQLFNQASISSREIAQLLLKDGTKWQFNPPGAPHHGGIWEAAVKSVKFHLKRVIGVLTLTFEELTTTLTQIEACLNSRPIQPLSDDPTDLDVLTPAHFLIGESLTTIPEPGVIDLPVNTLSRYQLLRRLLEDFWKRWSTEYLQSLQVRSKWKSQSRSIEVGDLCIILHENMPPCKWPLGRIEKTFPGDDGHVRVVLVKTATSTYKRPITKICILPFDKKDSSLTDEGGRNVTKPPISNLPPNTASSREIEKVLPLPARDVQGQFKSDLRRNHFD